MTKRNRRPSAPLSRAAFERELTKVVNGDPDADEHVRAFFEDMREALGIEAAVARRDGIEVLRRARGVDDHPRGSHQSDRRPRRHLPKEHGPAHGSDPNGPDPPPAS